MTTEIIAQACHEANKVWCLADNDSSQKHWKDAEDWQKSSALNGVKFKMENPFAGADAQHNSWMKEKIDDGWVYAAVKDAEAKTHPCIVPYSELPEFQRKKDSLFCAIVDALKPQTHRELTFGQKAVGFTFNHGVGEIFHQVQEAKATLARAIDQMNNLRAIAGPGEYSALCTIAIRSLQASQMAAVKAITWKD